MHVVFVFVLATVMMIAHVDGHPKKRKKIAAPAQSVPMKVVDSAHLRTGIACEVRMRPTAPVMAEGDVSWAPLPDAPIAIYDHDDKLLGVVKTGAKGWVYLELQQGTHYLRGRTFPGKMFPHPLDSQRIYVTKGQVIHVLIEYDTGIR